jgi:diacylglycerol kinase (ATP)
MEARLVVNPASGGETAEDHLPMMRARLGAVFPELDVVVTAAECDATEAGADAARAGCDRLFVAGGDGTLNEVLNGVASVEGGLAAVTLGIIPLGTGNDFASAIGVPEEPAAAVDCVLAARPRAIDVGRVNGRCFLNVSAGGFIAEVSEAVPSKLKTVLGKLAYLVGGAKAILDYEPVGTELRVRGGSDPGVPAAATLHAFAVCNSRLIGGGRLIAPHAVIDDGWLDVCLIHAMPTLEFLALLRRVSDGEHVEDERVTYVRARGLDLAFDRRIAINTDGQVFEADRCEYDVLPGAIRLLMPEGAPTATP